MRLMGLLLVMQVFGHTRSSIGHPMFSGFVPAAAAQGLNPKFRGLALNVLRSLSLNLLPVVFASCTIQWNYENGQEILKNVFRYQSVEQIEFNHMLEHHGSGRANNISIHPQGTIWVFTKFCAISSNNCWGILVWPKVVDQPIHWLFV